MMGAWGNDTFENDMALDWVIALEPYEDLTFVQNTLQNVINTSDYIDSGDAMEALAACEVVARMMGNWGKREEDVDNWVFKYHEIPSYDLVQLCDKVIGLILTEEKSELYALWDEAGIQPWFDSVDNLRERVLGERHEIARTELLFQDETSNKLWTIEQWDNEITTSYGKVGAKLRRSEKSLKTNEEAKKYFDKQVKAKVKKGYKPFQNDIEFYKDIGIVKEGTIFSIQLAEAKYAIGIVLHISSHFQGSMIAGFFDQLVTDEKKFGTVLNAKFFDTPNYTIKKALEKPLWKVLDFMPEILHWFEIPHLVAGYSLYYKDDVVKTLGSLEELAKYQTLIGQGSKSVENKLKVHFGIATWDEL